MFTSSRALMRRVAQYGLLTVAGVASIAVVNLAGGAQTAATAQAAPSFDFGGSASLSSNLFGPQGPQLPNPDPDPTDPGEVFDPNDPNNDPTYITGQRRDIYTWVVNNERTENGLNPVVRDEGLDDSAQAWAEKLSRSGKFEHDKMVCDESNRCMSENIAIATTLDSPEDIVSRWLVSPGHNANINRENAVAVGHGEAVMFDGPYAGQIVSVQRFWNQY